MRELCTACRGSHARFQLLQEIFGGADSGLQLRNLRPHCHHLLQLTAAHLGVARCSFHFRKRISCCALAGRQTFVDLILRAADDIIGKQQGTLFCLRTGLELCVPVVC